VTEGFAHTPVLLQEVLDFLEPEPGNVVLDCTLGGGGHARALLDQMRGEGHFIGLDVDEDALAAAAKNLDSYRTHIDLVRCSFRELDRALRELGIEFVDRILFDLGVSSWQLNRPERGFRFAREASERTPLDMRMDRRATTTASTLLKYAEEETLRRYFQDYGELPGSRRLARAIVEARTDSPLETTADLRAVIERTHIGRGRKHDPATLVFQALRIATNDELGALEQGLHKAIEHLRPGGRVAVISYHSLEDRIVKNLFREAIKGCTCPPSIPVCICGKRSTLRSVTRRPVVPSEAEKHDNPRARSAHLRVAERI